MERLLKYRTTLIVVGLTLLVIALGVAIGWITKPMLKQAFGMGIIMGAAAVMLVIPLWIIQKLWLWIKSKLKR